LKTDDAYYKKEISVLKKTRFADNNIIAAYGVPVNNSIKNMKNITDV
jgi:hypothetical protein